MTIVDVIFSTPRESGEAGVAELLVGVDVGGGDAYEVVGVAEEALGVADLGDLGELLFERGDGVSASSRCIVMCARTSNETPTAAASTMAR